MRVLHRFAVDRMLGRLATWLRLIGQDTTYSSHQSGRALVSHARIDGRTILTRSRELPRHAPDIPLLLIASDDFREQLRQVIDAFHIDPVAQLFTRCTRCNTAVVPVENAAAISRVPSYVFATQKHFFSCPSCRRIYWSATHREHVVRELAAMGLAQHANASDIRPS